MELTASGTWRCKHRERQRTCGNYAWLRIRRAFDGKDQQWQYTDYDFEPARRSIRGERGDHLMAQLEVDEGAEVALT